MKNTLLLVWAVLTSGLISAANPPPEVKSRLTRAAIFTNGTAALGRTATLNGQKHFIISDELNPVLGSLHFPHGAIVKKILAERPQPSTYANSELPELYAGKKITVWVNQGGDQVKVYSGTVLNPWTQDQQLRRYNLPLLLQQENGQIIMLRGRIVALQGADKVLPQLQKKTPMWEIFTPQSSNRFDFAYLSSGLKWYPAYRAELDGKNLKLFYNATVENNLEDFTDVQVDLVSGYPNFHYAPISDPLALLKNIPQRPSNANRFGRYKSLNYAPASSDMVGVSYQAPSEDIYYCNWGKISLKKGEAIRQELAQASTPYQKLVRWQIPAAVAESGFSVRHLSRYSNGNPQDCLKFVNPFNFPINQAPLEIVEQNRTLAQIEIPRLNPKAEILLQLTRAQTIEAKMLEYQVSQASQVTMFFARKYRLTEIQGELHLKNFRKSPAKLTIEADFSGTLLAADGHPKNHPHTGSMLVNPARQLVWEIELQPGESRKLTYRYNCYLNI